MSIIGTLFRVSLFGESHGIGVGTIVEGCPSGLSLNKEDIERELAKRRPGYSQFVSKRKERDEVLIFSGIYRGRTTGAPICMYILNKDVDSSPYLENLHKPRPGHADYPAWVKYGGFNDPRGGGIFSGRLTAGIVMAGAVAKKLLGLFGIRVVGWITQIGRVKASISSLGEIQVKYSDLCCPDPKAAKKMKDVLMKAMKDGDSVGGVVEVVAQGVPPGVGEPFFDTLEGDIAKALFAIPGVKGVEFGAGFYSASMKGSEYVGSLLLDGDKVVIRPDYSGGIQGGISNGMPLICKVAFHPPTSIGRAQLTVDLKEMKPCEISIKGRHDPCIAIRAVPVVESCLAIVLVDHMLRAGKIPRVLGEENESGRS
ncbi:MAG TPA: chorismate synthase [Candidatus Korarchaeota archaeon]|nr:chorismate synthase [Candidatus Korarchaeota archaeon]